MHLEKGRLNLMGHLKKLHIDLAYIFSVFVQSSLPSNGSHTYGMMCLCILVRVVKHAFRKGRFNLMGHLKKLRIDLAYIFPFLSDRVFRTEVILTG